MSDVIITNVGLTAITNASAGGFLIDIATFKVSNTTHSSGDLVPTTTALSGTIQYTGDISAIEILSDSSARFECTIPVTSTAKTLGEIGLFLRSGTLFAVGSIIPRITKDADTSCTLFIVVGASLFGGVLNVSVGTSVYLSNTPLASLPSPLTSNSNVYVVSDARKGFEYPSEAASLAIRYGSGNESWSFVGYNCVARVHPTEVYGVTSFKIEPSIQGFWLNDNEQVLVQIVSGAGQGETCSFHYHKKLTEYAHIFDTTKGFSALTTASTLQIWRDAANVLPDRRGVPSSHVLFTGEASLSLLWDTVSATPSTLKLHTVYFSGSAKQYTFTIPTGTPLSYLDKNNVLVFIAGVLQPFNNFNIYNDQLVITPLKVAAQITFLVFYRELTHGSAFRLYEELIEISSLVTYSGKPSFDMPIVVSSVKDSLGFSFAGSLGTSVPTFWTFSGAKLLFDHAPTTDTLMLVWGAEALTNSYSIIKQYEWLYDTNYYDSASHHYVFRLPDTPNDLNYLLFVQGKLVPKSLYTVTRDLQIPASRVPVSSGDYVKFVWIINALSATASEDPIEYFPNKIVPHTDNFTATSTTFTLTHPPLNDNYMLVFIEGLKQEKGVDWSLLGANTIVLTTALTASQQCAVLYFYDGVDANGSLLNNQIATFTLTTAASYTVKYPLESLQHVSVFVAGTFCHPSAYTITGWTATSTSFTLKFNAPLYPQGAAVEVIIWSNTPLLNSRTDLLVSYPTPCIGFKRFPVATSKILQQNTLMFIGPVYQHKSDYTVHDTEIALTTSIPYAALDPTYYDVLQLELYTFTSGRDLSRLDAELQGLATSTKVAQNTGPFWGDPAGTHRTPNKMTVSVASFVTAPATHYTFTPPYASDNILVFVHGALQYLNRDYVFISLGQIVFASEIPAGYPVDIITFQATEDPVGWKLEFKTYEQTYHTGSTFRIDCPVTDEENIFVFVEGIYFHRSWYTITTAASSFTLQFIGGLNNGFKVEVCVWTLVQQAGSYTEMSVQMPNPAIGTRSITLKEAILKFNSLVFAGPVYQNKSTYTLNQQNILLDTPISYEHVDPINFKDLPITVCAFRTGVSSTRLVTRNELQDNYLTRFGGDLHGPLYTLGDPEADLEVANKRYVDTLKDQVEAMRTLLANLAGATDAPTYAPILSVAPNLIKVGDVVTLKVIQGSPGKSVELEVRGTSGVYNKRSIKGMTKLDGTFTLGPVGIDEGYSDYLTLTAWVDGFRVANTIDVKVTDGTTTSIGPAMLAVDKDIYSPYDYITYSIADGTVGGRVTWSINGTPQTTIPAGQPQFISTDGTWSMQVPSGGVPTSYIVELFIDNISCGTVNVIVAATSGETLPGITYSAVELFRDEVLEITVERAKVYSPVTFSAKAIGVGRSGPQDTAGLINSDGTLNFGFRFTSAGDFIVYLNINKHLFTKAIKVKKVSPTELEVSEQPDGYRAYIKQF